MPAPEIKLDGFLPAEIAVRAEDAGVKKAAIGTQTMFSLAVLAGAFIALGAVFATVITAPTITANADNVLEISRLPFGIARLLGGFVFSLGLILVIVAGAELFTGNNLIVMAWASKKVSTASLLRNWIIVYIGNFVGSFLTAGMMILTNQYEIGHGAVGLNALAIGEAKTSLGFIQAVALGVFCNVLVCLAVWLCLSARSTTDKILATIFPITAFVAGGFEHCIANMYFVPKALFIKSMAHDSFWTKIGKTAADFPNLTWPNFLLKNLLPVTIGNIIGGAVLVGVVYWSIYLRPNKKAGSSLKK